MRVTSPWRRCALTAPFHPCLCATHVRSRHRRSALCGTFPRVSPGGRYPPPCPVVSGLSSKTPFGDLRDCLTRTPRVLAANTKQRRDAAGATSVRRAGTRRYRNLRSPALRDTPGTPPGREPSRPPRRRGSLLPASPRTARTDGSRVRPQGRSRDPPENPDHAAEEARVAGANRLHALVLRLQPDLILLSEEALDGGLVLEQGHHDLAVATALRGAHHDEVAVQDAGVDH